MVLNDVTRKYLAETKDCDHFEIILMHLAIFCERNWLDRIHILRTCLNSIRRKVLRQ